MKIAAYYRKYADLIVMESYSKLKPKCEGCGRELRGEVYVVKDEEGYVYHYGEKCFYKAVEKGEIHL